MRHASTAAVRHAAFGADEPLDGAGHDEAAALRDALPAAGEVLVSPALRARETAAAAGLTGAREVAALAECDFGRWAGRALADVDREEPDAVRAWMSEPGAAPHGGESLIALMARVGGWLADQARLEGSAIAVTHAGVIRAAVAHALGAPPSACWRIEVAPASVSELCAHDGNWTVARLNERPRAVHRG